MFEKMFTPGKIGTMEVPNRLVVTAMVTNYNNEDGTLTERYMRYHEERARGGFGLIITEDYAINENAKGYQRIAGLYNDEQIEKNVEFTNRIHALGSKIVCQIYSPGRQTTHFVNGGVQPVAPSRVPCLLMKEMPREMTVDEIHEFVEQFGDAAARAKKAGFDGVELHCAHGYLLGEFLSPIANKRTDEYGGNFENRVRIVREVMANMRSKVGEEYPILVRISAIDCAPGSKSFLETLALVKLLEQLGFDAIDVSTGVYGATNPYLNNGVTMYTEAGSISNLAKTIRENVSVPVINSNGYNDPYIAEAVLVDGRADFVGMGRQSLADPHTPVKAKNGDVQSIRNCVQCFQGCTGSLGKGGDVTCLVNPEVGLEYLANYEKAETCKNVMVVGGGLAGMQAALTAARRGHKATIYEAKGEMGGQWIAAAYPPCKSILTSFTVWLKKELADAGVAVKLGVEITAETIEAVKPDVLVVATGGKARRPNIPGADRGNVYDAEEVLVGESDPRGIIAVCGGGETGCETAALLAQRVDKVKIVATSPDFLVGNWHKPTIVDILQTYGVEIVVNAKLLEFNDEGVVVQTPDGVKTIVADNVVIAKGYDTYNPFGDAANGLCDEVYVVGNASESGDGLKAIAEGYQVGMKI